MVNKNYISNRASPIITSYAIADVNGDKIPDYVYLTGIKTESSPFFQNITLIIQDGYIGRSTSIAPQENAGYNPVLFLGDFTGDGVADIMVSINSGGSGGIMYHYIYSDVGNTVRQLFNFEEYNSLYQYIITYKDYYLVEVRSSMNNMKYLLNISYKGQEYLNEIYNRDGILKAPVSGFVNPLSVLQPVDLNSDKVYELLAFQKIAGRYNADSLGYVQNILKWENNLFRLDNQTVAIFGAED